MNIAESRPSAFTGVNRSFASADLNSLLVKTDFVVVALARRQINSLSCSLSVRVE